MKATLIATLATSLALAVTAAAQDKDDHKHDHDHAMAGPNGGKVLHEVDPHAEIFVTKERKLQITFLDHDGKAVAPTTQTVTVTCGKRTAPVRMTFAKKGDALLSDKALPDGMNIPTVLQIKTTPEAKATVIRLNLNLEECPTCEHLEYACTCDHGDHGHDDHDHKDDKAKK